MLNFDGTKTCPRCAQQLPTSDFYKINRKTGDGFSGYCRNCTKKSAVSWQQNNPEKMRVRWREDRKTMPPERREKAYALSEAWRIKALASDPDKFHAQEKSRRQRWKRQDPVRYRIKNAILQNRFRARKKGVPSEFLLEDWYRLLEAFEGRCAWCGGKPPFLDLDHIISLHRGGHDVVGNISPICRPCNSHKSYSTPEEFAAFMKVDLDELKRKCQVREEAATGTAA